MPNATAADDRVRFEGMSVGTELWGMTQANFLVSLPGRHAKEAAVLLNDAAAKLVAEAAGVDDTPQLRERLAMETGKYWLRHQLDAGASVESAVIVSSGLLREHPDLLEHLKRSVGA
jgi:hypothetical protein